MPSNAQTTMTTEAPPSSFASIFSNFGKMALTTVGSLLQTKAEGEIALEQAKNDLEVQRLFNENARQNHGTNDPADASRAAAEQTQLLFGFLPVRKSLVPIMTFAFVAIGVILTVAIAKSIVRR